MLAEVAFEDIQKYVFQAPRLQ